MKMFCYENNDFPSCAISIAGTIRLEKYVHDYLIKRIFDLEKLRIDYIIENDNIDENKYIERKINKHYRQMYKHWDIISNLPEKYTHIIRIRNDILIEESPSVIKHLKHSIKFDYAIGFQKFGSIMSFKNIENRLEKKNDLGVGDLILIHPRNKMLNPYEIFSDDDRRIYRHVIRSPHIEWMKLFNGNALHSHSGRIRVVRDSNLTLTN